MKTPQTAANASGGMVPAKFAKELETQLYAFCDALFVPIQDHYNARQAAESVKKAIEYAKELMQEKGRQTGEIYELETELTKLKKLHFRA